MLLPFAVVLAICLCVKDLSYPALRLRAAALGGLGQVGVSGGNHTCLPASATYQPTLGSSDDAWQGLYDSYYNHSSARWGAVVVRDRLERWLESTLRVEEASLRGRNATALWVQLVALQGKMCAAGNGSAGSSGGGGEGLLLCGAALRVRLDARNSSARAIVIHSYRDLVANATLLSNATADHAAPIFLREVLGGLQGCATNPRYELASHPLPLINYSSQVGANPPPLRSRR